MQKYYFSQLGCWHNPDKFVEDDFSVSPYGYAANDPENMIDVAGQYFYTAPDPQIYIPYKDNGNPYNIGKQQGGGTTYTNNASSDELDNHGFPAATWARIQAVWDATPNGSDNTYYKSDIEAIYQARMHAGERHELLIPYLNIGGFTSNLPHKLKYWRFNIFVDQWHTGIHWTSTTYSSHGQNTFMETPPDGDPRTYTVQQGDGMYKIDRDEFNWQYSYSSWLRANPTLKMDGNGNPMLKPGQVINVPKE